MNAKRHRLDVWNTKISTATRAKNFGADCDGPELGVADVARHQAEIATAAVE